MSPRTAAGRLWRSRFARFLVMGGVAACVNIGSRVGFSTVMPFGWAILAAYLCGMTAAWALNRMLVFRPSQGHWSREYGRFALVNVLAAAQVWLISEGLAGWLFPLIGMVFHPEAVAHVIGVAAPVFTSYWGHKHFSFAADMSGREADAGEPVRHV